MWYSLARRLGGVKFDKETGRGLVWQGDMGGV